MLFRKMLRDMRKNLGQFISIFIMAFLASFVFSGINAEWYGMQIEASRYYEETKLADIWMNGNSFDKEDAGRIKEVEGIRDAALRFNLSLPVYTDKDKVLNINVIEDNIISMPKIIKGSPLDTISDGIWLDFSYAEANDLEIGDKIQVELPGMILEKNILGFVQHPEYVYSSNDNGVFMPDHENYGFAFLYSSSLPENLNLRYNQILISLRDGVNEDDIIKKLEEMFSDRYLLIIEQTSHPSVSAFNNEIEQNKAMGGVFPVVFFLIAALSILTTMTRITNSQRTQIATLKALGFTGKRILVHYVSYGIWIGLVGGLLGLFIGPLVIPPILFTLQKTMYTLPDWRIAISKVSLLVVALLALSCGLSSYLACRGHLKEVPAAALRPKAPRSRSHSKIEKSKLWYKLSFAIQWNLRDIIRSRIRSCMAFIGVLGCTGLLLFGLGLRDTVNSVSNWMYMDLNVYESKINFDPTASDEVISTLTSNISGQLIQESNAILKLNDRKENGFLTVLDTGDMIRFEDVTGQIISLPDKGIGISYKMAELLDAKIGDMLEWKIYGQRDWIKSEIAVIYRTPMGQGIAISKDVYEESSQSFKPTSLLTSDSIDNIVPESAVENTQNKESLMSSFNELLESIRMIIAILVMGAVLLGSVVLYNLGALSFTERIRELATLKVLGFHPKQIRSLLNMQNVWLTILGIVAGVPIGFILLSFMLSIMPASLDMREAVSHISVIISVVGTFIVSITVNLLLSRNIRGVDMVSALKSVE